MQPVQRLFYLCKNSQCQHFMQIIKHKNACTRLYSHTATQKSRKSALFTKREAKIVQTNIPVELDLEIGKRLKVKDQLRLELAARNLHSIDVNELERDYYRLTDLENRKLELNGKIAEIRDQIKNLNEEKKNSHVPSEGLDRQIETVVQQSREKRGQVKELEPELRDIEERLTFTALDLPNRLHKDTPHTSHRVEEVCGKELPPSPSHMEIGQMFDLIKFSNVGEKAYYFQDHVALLEEALINYFCDMMRKDGYIQIASPEFFKQLVVEGCGIDMDQVIKLNSNSADSSDYLAGSSIMSLVAHVTKSRVNLPENSLQYFTCGRSYRPVTENDLPGLFGATQSVKMNMMSLCRDSESCYEVLQSEKNKLWELYRQLDIPCRLVTVSAPSLHRTEEMRIELQMWAKSIQQFIKVASVSMVSDYISRRLMIRHFKGQLPVFMTYTEALDVTRLIAVLLEYGSIEKETYSLPRLTFLEGS